MFTDNKNLYPTPLSLIYKMLSDVDYNRIKTILEPSAGKGDILEVLNKKKEYYKHLDIDCIEIDKNLQHILKGKNFKLVHDDFLTFDSMKQYDLIVAKFPFSDGEKHLLKALQMQEIKGGGLVCLVNAETLKNDYTNVRKDINKKLEEYNATIEFIQDAFIDAERKTGVEIALIKVLIPSKSNSSFILDGLKKAQEQREYAESEQTSVVENDFLKAIVNQYNLEVKAGINLIKEYYTMSPFILSEFSKDGKKGSPILKLDLSRNTNGYKNELSVNSYIEEVRKKYWKALFHNEKFIGQLTENLRHEFYNKIEDLKQYDFTLYNVYELKLQMNKNITKGIEETILNLFDEFSHKHHWYNEMSSNIHFYNGWKTNSSFKINKKVIVPLCAYDSYTGRYNPTHYKTLEKLQDIEKVFNYLDKGVSESMDIKEQLAFAEGYGETKKIETKFFFIDFYKKGTMHLTFKDEKLLDCFNLYGSQKKGWLPQGFGKQKYNDMSQEAKEVVISFCGKDKYNVILDNKDYYLNNNGSLLMIGAENIV